ncbi:MAG: hypothetical protein ACTSQI_10400 [Candidatus Helarchaeota archaeon]
MSSLIGNVSIVIGILSVVLITITAELSFYVDVYILLLISLALGISAIALGITTWIFSELKMNVGIFSIILGIYTIIFYYIIPLF